VNSNNNSSSSAMPDLERGRVQNEALASFHLKLTDKAQKYRSASISDQSKIKLACWDTFMQSINDAIRCLEHVQVFGGPDKEQEIQDIIRWGLVTLPVGTCY
jgi:hypothetical protein